MESFNLKQYLESQCERVNKALGDLLPGEDESPQRLHEAMRYTVFAGGKRLRPVLIIAAADAVSPIQPPENERAILEAGAAVEFLHTYSLVHDDLPAMDNDDLRRGRPTCHKAYDEATAILVGDALQALAFQTLAQLSATDAEKQAKCVSILGEAVGSVGMVGGQMEDPLCEGCENPTPDQVVSIHQRKTAALLRACCAIGATLGGGNPEDIARMNRYGSALGLAFQIIDDILDIVGDEANLGKTVGKDESVSKATYPAVFGMEVAREKAHQLIAEAHGSIAHYGLKAKPLGALADFVAERDR